MATNAIYTPIRSFIQLTN